MDENEKKASAEARLKCALIEHLRATGYLDDAVLVNEFAVNSWANRADLVVANGKLLAFEIKSAADRLHRLAQQLRAFQAFFDKVFAVVDQRHIAAAMELLPEGVELWSAHHRKGKYHFTCVTRGRRKDITDKNILVRMLNASELKYLLKNQGIACSKLRRSDLEEEAQRLPICRLRDALLQSIKLRYRASDLAFRTATTGMPVDPENLNLLRRYPLHERQEHTARQEGWDFLLEAGAEENPFIDMGKENKSFGPVPKDVSDSISPNTN